MHDPGSVALLNRLLAEIAAQGIPTLITSNYEPESLLSDPTFHHVIEPSIRTLRSNFQIETLDGGNDYRKYGAAERGSGFAAGRWLVAGLGQDSHNVLIAAGLMPPRQDEAVTVLEGHRALRASAVRDTEIWFDFTSVPRLSQAEPAARQRFVTLIDVLVERDFPLTVCSEVALDAFVDIAEPPPDLFRTHSRLKLLRSVTGSKPRLKIGRHRNETVELLWYSLLWHSTLNARRRSYVSELIEERIRHVCRTSATRDVPHHCINNY